MSKGNEDPFVVHFEEDLDESVEKNLSDLNTWHKKATKVSYFLLILYIVQTRKLMSGAMLFPLTRNYTLHHLSPPRPQLFKGWITLSTG